MREKEAKNNPSQRNKGLEPLVSMDAEIDKLKNNMDYHKNITDDIDIKKNVDKIKKNLNNTITELTSGTYQDPWKKREMFWNGNDAKKKFARQMVDKDDKGKDSIINLKDPIEHYELRTSEVQASKSTDKVGCIILDNTVIKDTIVKIILDWQTEYLKAIQSKAISDLDSLEKLF